MLIIHVVRVQTYVCVRACVSMCIYRRVYIYTYISLRCRTFTQLGLSS